LSSELPSESGASTRKNDVGKQRVLRMDLGATLDDGDDRDAYIDYIFWGLMDLAAHAAIGGARKRRPIDTDHEVPSGARENYNLVHSILGNLGEGVRNLCVSFCGERERSSVIMHLHERHTLGVPGQL